LKTANGVIPVWNPEILLITELMS